MTRNSDKFPDLVKEVRRQLGISQEALAHELGVSFATINRWEN
ncbi:MAG: helix-turn-helix transcriptional regulator, partial [Deltaproteobacteria bacterium]|nr:helix-turn-helix transcriptional regulator [Deltaproteobacteria bacterium]